MTGRITICLVLSGLAGFSAEANAARFYRLGALNGGHYFSEALNVSPDGRVVVGSAVLGTEGWEAFQWTKANGVQPIGDIPGGIHYSKAYSVSNEGRVIVGLGSNQGNSAFLDGFRWTRDTGPVGIGYFDASEPAPYNYALGVSADGEVIAGVSRAPEGNQAYRWTIQEGMIRIGDLPGGDNASYAWDISADGKVIVGASDSDRGLEPFRWTSKTGMRSLGELSNSLGESHAWAVSADGSTIVGQSGRNAWRWTEVNGMMNLGTLPGFGEQPSIAALGVSAEGDTIVGDIRSNGYETEAAFLWTASTGIRVLQSVLELEHNLRLPGWTLTHATAISDDGTVIVGSGTNPLGTTEAWVIDLGVPEPSAGTLWICAMSIAAIYRAGSHRAS